MTLALQLLNAYRIPALTCVTSLTWVLHDYCVTLEDEIAYIWTSPWNFGKILFFWVRYYTIALTVFDVAQIHSFSKFYPSLSLCVAMDVITRVVGGVALWAIELVMQVRIWALFSRSKRVAAFNGVLFLASIAAFLWILIHNALALASVIKDAKQLPVPGCPDVHVKLEFAQWIPATAYEAVLFAFVLTKTAVAVVNRAYNKRVLSRVSLYSVILHDNQLYFFGVTGLLVFNNLMVINATKIPWFSFGPFHAALGIMTGRLLIHLRKSLEDETSLPTRRSEVRFAHPGP